MFFHKKEKENQPQTKITPNTIRKYVLFKGHVQGVGFRWEAKLNADKFHLTGWVRNLYDGSVECEIQGELSTIRLWIKELYADTYIDIESYEMKDLKVVENERSFDVHY